MFTGKYQEFTTETVSLYNLDFPLWVCDNPVEFSVNMFSNKCLNASLVFQTVRARMTQTVCQISS